MNNLNALKNQLNAQKYSEGGVIIRSPVLHIFGMNYMLNQIVSIGLVVKPANYLFTILICLLICFPISALIGTIFRSILNISLFIGFFGAILLGIKLAKESYYVQLSFSSGEFRVISVKNYDQGKKLVSVVLHTLKGLQEKPKI